MSFVTGLVIGSLGGGLIVWAANWLYRQHQHGRGPAPLRELLIALKLERDDAKTDTEQIEAQFMFLNESLQTAHANNEQLQNELTLTTQRSQRYEAEIEALQVRLLGMKRERERLQSELTMAHLSAQQPQASFGSLEPGSAAARLPPAVGAPNAASPSLEPQSETNPAAAGRIHTGTIFDRDRLMIMPEPLGSVPPKTQATQRNPLSDINGIGPIYAQKLFDAGIRTLSDLAALSPERVRAIIDPRPWRAIDVERWITEARQRTQPA